MSSIKCDDIALELVSGPSRDRYVKVWKQFKAFSKMSNEFENRMPSEDEFMDFFRHLRIELKQSSSTLWTTYSMVNSVCKGKYGEKLQKFPRITSLLKSYDSDVKKKAAVFELGRSWKVCFQHYTLNPLLAGPEKYYDTLLLWRTPPHRGIVNS